GLAQLLGAAQGRGGNDGGYQLRDGAKRSPLRAMRRPSRPCLRRRAAADGSALLHGRRRPGLPPRRCLIASLAGRRRRFRQGLAIITSVDFTTASTSSPTLTARSSTESTKIAETTLAPPPTSTVTWAMTAPFLMAVILPLRALRALIFMAFLRRVAHGRA